VRKQRRSTGQLTVIGIAGDDGYQNGVDLDPKSKRILSESDLVIGSSERISIFEKYLTSRARTLVIGSSGLTVHDAVQAIAEEPGRVCVLASGDPGFFGIVRLLAENFGSECLDVRPAPSSVSLAFARLGIPWDDSAVISAHGRPIERAAAMACRYSKVAILTSPEACPSALSVALGNAGANHQHCAVFTCLGSTNELLQLTTIDEMADIQVDGNLALVILWSGDGISSTASTSWPVQPQRVEWGLPVSSFDHRRGLITKPEARAIVLARLAIAPTGVLWDLGAGSGSIGIEAARLFPSLRVIAVDRNAEACEHIKANSSRFGVDLEVIHGEIPEILDRLERPDSIFIGGGTSSRENGTTNPPSDSSAMLRYLISLLTPRGRVVATYAAIDRALEAYRLLGNMSELALSHGTNLPGGGIRLSPDNPIFIAWGPSQEHNGTSEELH